jgi:hypothetical protein
VRGLWLGRTRRWRRGSGHRRRGRPRRGRRSRPRSRCWRGALWCEGIQLLDHVVRHVDAGIPRDDPRVGAAEQDLQAPLLPDLLYEWQDLLLEIELQFLLQLIDLSLRILLEALALALLRSISFSSAERARS